MFHDLLFNCPCHYGWPQFWRIVVLVDLIFSVLSLFPVHSQKKASKSGSEIWKHLGYAHKCSFGKACVPISRQNINRCYSAAIFWKNFADKQTVQFVLTLASDRSVLNGNDVHSVLVVSTKKQCSSFMKKLFVFQKFVSELKYWKCLKLSLIVT